MRYLLILLIFASCTTSRKSSSSTTSNIDSTVIKDQAAFIAELEKELSKKKTDSFTQIITNVVFDTVDREKVVVVFDEGKIKSISGKLTSLTQSHNASLQREESLEKSRDSLAIALESEKTNKKIEIKEVVKEVKRTVTPIWVWFVIALLIAALLRAYFPRIIDFFKRKS